MNKIALVQMNSSDQLQSNIDQSLQLIEEAALSNASLIAFPETFLYMGSSDELSKIAEIIPGKLTNIYQKAAKKYNISILLGSIIETPPIASKKFYNSSILIDNRGEVLAKYRKIHLYDVDLPNIRLYESDQYLAGDEIIACNHEIARIGLTICYDVRFPNLYSKLAQKGAQLIFVPAAFTLETGKDHWIPLLQARAIENQVYIAAPAQFGRHYGNRVTYGNSVIIDPWGTVISKASYKTEIIYADIDLKYLQQVRQQMPVYQHKVENIDY